MSKKPDALEAARIAASQAIQFAKTARDESHRAHILEVALEETRQHAREALINPNYTEAQRTITAARIAETIAETKKLASTARARAEGAAREAKRASQTADRAYARLAAAT